jgi:hypothetical protein
MERKFFKHVFDFKFAKVVFVFQLESKVIMQIAIRLIQLLNEF